MGNGWKKPVGVMSKVFLGPKEDAFGVMFVTFLSELLSSWSVLGVSFKWTTYPPPQTLPEVAFQRKKKKHVKPP